VIQSFGDAATDALYHGRGGRSARSLPKPLWPIILRKLDKLNAATRLEDLMVPPGNRLEALKGDRKGRLSIRVNRQYRITFRFAEGNAFDVRCEDDH